MTLTERRTMWERGTKVCTVIEGTYGVYVVTESTKVNINNEKRYRCLRYFQIPKEGKYPWEVSVDHDEVKLDTVWEWLSTSSREE
jgi:hypothetical protein